MIRAGLLALILADYFALTARKAWQGRESGRLLHLFGAGMLLVIAFALLGSLGPIAVGWMAYAVATIVVMARPDPGRGADLA